MIRPWWRVGSKLCIGDLTSGLDRLVQGCEATIHCAAAIRGIDPVQLHSINAQASERLASATPNGNLFVQISTLAARLPEISPYAASKAAGERLVLAHSGRLRVIVVRPRR